jgi:hypothetical protein
MMNADIGSLSVVGLRAYGFAVPGDPRRCYVHAAASFDDDVVFAVRREELDHVAVRIDDDIDS